MMNSKLYFREARRSAHRSWSIRKDAHRLDFNKKHPIDFKFLSVRVTNVLRRMNVHYDEDLKGVDNKFLLQQPKMGKVSVEEIKDYLNEKGITHHID